MSTKYTDFESELGRGKATVHVAMKDDGFSRKISVRMHCNCCGVISIEDAVSFRDALNKAIDFAIIEKENQK